MRVTLKSNKYGTVKEHLLSIGGVSSFGRSSKCDFKLANDEKVSSQHCRFLLKSDRLEIVDLDSKNGTYLNGIRIETSEVFVGDKVKIGDTVITLDENSLDAEALDVLTFPGPARDRLSYTLKADFTGARNLNQSGGPNVDRNIQASHAKEVELRKKIKSKIKLSKQEIRARNKIISFLSTAFDIALMVLMLIIPILILAKFVPVNARPQQKNIFLMILEGATVAIFFITNFKVAKFSFGERLSGLRKLYLNQ